MFGLLPILSKGSQFGGDDFTRWCRVLSLNQMEAASPACKFG